jgi:hypothetical protein
MITQPEKAAEAELQSSGCVLFVLAGAGQRRAVKRSAPAHDQCSAPSP